MADIEKDIAIIRKSLLVHTPSQHYYGVAGSAAALDRIEKFIKTLSTQQQQEGNE